VSEVTDSFFSITTSSLLVIIPYVNVSMVYVQRIFSYLEKKNKLVRATYSLFFPLNRSSSDHWHDFKILIKNKYTTLYTQSLCMRECHWTPPNSWTDFNDIFCVSVLAWFKFTAGRWSCSWILGNFYMDMS